MDVETARQLINATSGLVGAVIGAGATLAVAAQQHKRSERSALASETWAHNKAAMLECQTIFREMRQDVPTSEGADCDEQREASHRVVVARRRLLDLRYDLPDDVRNRLAELQALLWNVDMFYRWHYVSLHSIVRVLTDEADAVLTAALTHKAIPEKSHDIKEFEVAMNEAWSDLGYDEPDEQTEMYLDHMEKWYEKHPEMRLDPSRPTYGS
jgi:hypothetical protein